MKPFSKECIVDLRNNLGRFKEWTHWFQIEWTKEEQLDKFLEKFYQVVIDEFSSVNHTELREGFEDMLLETGRYTKPLVSEIDDGFGEYIDEIFEAYYGKLDTLDKCKKFLDSLS